MKVWKFALIGCGRIGERHAEHIISKAVLAAVCDINKERADLFSKKYKVSAYYTIEDLLAAETNVDVAVICTPNGLHATHTISCLQAGMHVLCEKPMAITVEDCRSMIDAAERNNKLLAIVKQNRFNPPVVAVKQIMDEGRLGKILSVQLNCFWNRDAAYYQNSWKGTLDIDGGTLFTQFSHFIDLLFWMFGEIIAVESFMDNFAHRDVIEFEDTGVAIVKFKSNAIGTIHYTVNSFARNMEGSLTIFGEKGTVKIGGEYLNRLEYQNINDHCMEELPAGNTANHYGSYVGSMSNHDKVYDNLLAALQTGAAVSTNAFEGYKTVEIIEKIYQSAKRV